MGKLSRTKGRDFQAEIARRLQPQFPRVHSGAQHRGAQACSADVEGTPFHVECKHQKRPSPASALKQAERESDGRPAIAVIKADGTHRGKELVVMRWNTLAGLLGIPMSYPAMTGKRPSARHPWRGDNNIKTSKAREVE